jgi:hypothetical protein
MTLLVLTALATLVLGYLAGRRRRPKRFGGCDCGMTCGDTYQGHICNRIAHHDIDDGTPHTCHTRFRDANRLGDFVWTDESHRENE